MAQTPALHTLHPSFRSVPRFSHCISAAIPPCPLQAGAKNSMSQKTEADKQPAISNDETHEACPPLLKTGRLVALLARKCRLKAVARRSRCDVLQRDRFSRRERNSHCCACGGIQGNWTRQGRTEVPCTSTHRRYLIKLINCPGCRTEMPYRQSRSASAWRNNRGRGGDFAIRRCV